MNKNDFSEVQIMMSDLNNSHDGKGKRIEVVNLNKSSYRLERLISLIKIYSNFIVLIAFSVSFLYYDASLESCPKNNLMMDCLKIYTQKDIYRLIFYLNLSCMFSSLIIILLINKVHINRHLLVFICVSYFFMIQELIYILMVHTTAKSLFYLIYFMCLQ